MKIATYFFSIGLSLILLISSTKVSLTYAYYNLDPIGFIEILCENKDQPELQCNGKCQLKKMTQTQNENQNSPENIFDFKDINLYQHTIQDNNEVNKVFSKKQLPKIYLNLYTFTKTNEFFHPPRI